MRKISNSIYMYYKKTQKSKSIVDFDFKAVQNLYKIFTKKLLTVNPRKYGVLTLIIVLKNATFKLLLPLPFVEGHFCISANFEAKRSTHGFKKEKCNF